MKQVSNRGVGCCLPAAAILLTLCAMVGVTGQTPQDEESDRIRRLWNLQFRTARARKSASASDKTKTPAEAGKDAGKAETPPDAAVEGELLGITIWRMRSATLEDRQDRNRLLLQQTSDQHNSFLPERVGAETRFKEGSMVRLGFEVPRQTRSYLYVFDHEVYDDGTTGDAYQIFPSQTTPPAGNLVEPGQLIFVPAQGDPIPWFTLRKVQGHRTLAREMLTIIVSPEPLPANLVVPVHLSADLVLPRLNQPMKELEKAYGGPAEKRDASSGAGNPWTVAEKESGEGKRLLLQQDPLPHTIYRVRVNPGSPFLVQLPLWLAQ
ncbi:MAG TPA: hypothetical protein VJ302_26100 [Blastocatellia bacterium]|nr:hypothetical protein [Blastocatellia bacterium]